VPWGKDMRRILAAYPQYYKATARTVRAKREHHGPVRAPSWLPTRGGIYVDEYPIVTPDTFYHMQSTMG
jgi:hypothetical protein